MGGGGVLRIVAAEEGADAQEVEIAVPVAVRARAEEIVRLSRCLGELGGGFTSASEVLAPALIYGLAHMQERYSHAALRRYRELAALAGEREGARERVVSGR